MSAEQERADIFTGTREQLQKILGSDYISATEFLNTLPLDKAEQKKAELPAKEPEAEVGRKRVAEAEQETPRKPVQLVDHGARAELTRLGCSEKEIWEYLDSYGNKKLDELTIKQLESLIADTWRLSDRIRDAARPVLEAKKAERTKERSDSIMRGAKLHRENQAANTYPIDLYFPSERGYKDIFYHLPSTQFVYRKGDGDWYFSYFLTMLKGWDEAELKTAKEQRIVPYAGPVSGWDTAYLKIDKDTRIVATGMRDHLDYEAAAEDYSEEKWSDVRQFLIGALGDQLEGSFWQWCISLMNPKLYCDRTLVLTGDRETAEKLQRIITLLTGNRQKNAEAYLTGASKLYNVDLIGSEHLVYDGAIGLKVRRMLKKFWTARRDVYVPGGKVSFMLPKLWQRLSIITDEKSLDRLKDHADRYIVLKLYPAKLTEAQLDREIDYLGFAIRSDVDIDKTEQTPAYWYQNAAPEKVDGWDLLEAIDSMPFDLEWTGGYFVKTTSCPKSAKVMGRPLKAIADKKELLTWRCLDGERLYKRVKR